MLNLVHKTLFTNLSTLGLMDLSYNRSYFFDTGIRFECQRCGACCTGSPGTIYVDRSEMSRIAEFLRIPVPLFREQYLYPFRDSYSIREDSEGRCFFYDNGCDIYPLRPNQCRSFPFWVENLRSEAEWQKVSIECPGIGRGQLFTKEQILEIVQSTFT
ncbi:hypothetical protein ES703_99230 [subsurface metagenome]